MKMEIKYVKVVMGVIIVQEVCNLNVDHVHKASMKIKVVIVYKIVKIINLQIVILEFVSKIINYKKKLI